MIAADRLVVCPVVALERLAGARDEDAFRPSSKRWARCPGAGDPDGLRAGDRRVPGPRREPASPGRRPPDRRGRRDRAFGILHDDRHLDVLCDALGIESVPIVPLVTLD